MKQERREKSHEEAYSTSALFSYTWSVCVLCHFSHIQLFTTLRSVVHQAPLPRGFPGKNTGMGCHALLQRIFLTQGSKVCFLWLLHCRRVLYCWAAKEVHVYRHLKFTSSLILATFLFSFLFKTDLFLFIYLAVLGLHCGNEIFPQCGKA